MTLQEQIASWNAMTIAQLEQRIADGHEYIASLAEAAEGGEEHHWDAYYEEIYEAEHYLDIAQGIVAQKYLQQMEDESNEG